MCCYVFTIDRQAVIALSHLYQWMTSWTPPLRLETRHRIKAYHSGNPQLTFVAAFSSLFFSSPSLLSIF